MIKLLNFYTQIPFLNTLIELDFLIPKTFSLFFGFIFYSWYLWQVIVKAFLFVELDRLPKAKCIVFTDIVESMVFYVSKVLSLRKSYDCSNDFFYFLLNYWRERLLELWDRKWADLFRVRFMYLGVGKADFLKNWGNYFEECDEKIELRSICFLGMGFGFFIILGNLSVLIIPPYLLRFISCIFSLKSPKLFSFPQHSD